MRPRQRTLADWQTALEASGWEGRKARGEWSGPCPVCGGTDRFHVAAGRRVAVVASCRKGCGFPEIARAVFGDRPRPSLDPWRNGRPAWQGEPRGSRKTAPRAAPSPSSSPSRSVPDARAALAARLWWHSVPVPPNPEHPARRWAARRDLWPASRPFPDTVRWLSPWRVRPGAVIAAFAPLGPGPAPSGVQCVHIGPDGSPATDRDGLGKRSHGSMRGAVCLIGDPLPEAVRVHVAEGLADALAIAARCDGVALAAGGTSGFPRLADPLATLSLPVTVWPDGDPEGRKAAQKLAEALRARGLPVHVAPVPDSEDPASMAGPGNEWRNTA